MSFPQIWNIEKEKDREKWKVRRQASEAQREKERLSIERKLIVISTIWNIEKEKDREKEKIGDRPAELNEKKSD